MGGPNYALLRSRWFRACLPIRPSPARFPPASVRGIFAPMKSPDLQAKGLRIEQINRALGTPSGQLARPILQLLEQCRIKKTGDRRATKYFPI